MKMMLWCIILVFNVIDLSAKPDFLVKLEIEKNNGIFWVQTTITNMSDNLITIPVTVSMGIDGRINGESPSWITLNVYTKSGKEIDIEKNKIYYYRDGGKAYIVLKKGESYTRVAPLFNNTLLHAEGFLRKECSDVHSIQAKIHLAYFCVHCEQKENVEDILSNRVIIE